MEGGFEPPNKERTSNAEAWIGAFESFAMVRSARYVDPWCRLVSIVPELRIETVIDRVRVLALATAQVDAGRRMLGRG